MIRPLLASATLVFAVSPALADDPAVARAGVAAQVAVMGVAVGVGHQHADVVADHFAGGVAELALGRRAKGLDNAVLAHDDDGVGHGFQNAS